MKKLYVIYYRYTTRHTWWVGYYTWTHTNVFKAIQCAKEECQNELCTWVELRTLVPTFIYSEKSNV